MINLSSLLGGGMLLKQQLFTAGGVWERPARMAGNTVWLTMIGGGSSGRSGSYANGGSSGQYVIRMPVDIGELESVICTIGAGGAPSAEGANSNPGEPTSFGSLVTMLGGTTTTPPPGAPGGSNANISLAAGGDTPLGYGGRPISTSVTACGGGGLKLDDTLPTAGVPDTWSQVPAQGYGAGGGARSSSSSGAGAGGAILVEWPEFA